MYEAQRVEHIERLITGIGLIGPGSIFERFGAKFLDHHLDADLVHRGLNAQLNPVGGTVDSVDDAGKLAAEYSIEKDYFQARWAKPTKDVLHVLKLHPGVSDVYLVSSQRSTPADIKVAKARVKDWPGFHGRTIHYYDARRIAEVIVDELLLDDAAVRALVEHLPVLDRVLNEHRATLTVPAIDPRRVALITVDEAIDAALRSGSSVVTISGLAGSGKSDAAAAYVNSRCDRYQTTMWVEGAELSQVADLTSKRLWRGGADLNVAGMLRIKRCLLVIDDLPPNIAPADLQPLCISGTHILVTRRESAPGDVSIPALSTSEAREILDRDISERCPDAVLQALMKVVGGHPLSLALANKAAASGVPWSEIGEDCDSITELVDGRERLADRILGRLKPLLATELAVFDWVGKSSCDYRFLKSIIRMPGMMKIGGQGLRAADRPAIIRLHDVVYASLKVQGWLSETRAAALDQQLDVHLGVLIEEESLALLMLATTMRTKLESIAKTRFSPAVLVALQAVWRPEDLDTDAFSAPETYLSNLEVRGTPVSYVEVRLILETIESLYRFDKLESIDAAKATLTERLPLFERLLALKLHNSRSFAETRHHWGKALKILGHVEDASREFEAVLASANPLDATRLQLIRLYAGKNDRAVHLADEILTAAQIPMTVISSVVLGVVENLSWAKGPALQALFDKHAGLIEREIIAAADAGLEQAYAALASVGRYWSWHEPAKLKKIFGAIPVPTVETADDRTSAALGEILLKLAKSNYPPDRELQNQAVCYYRSIAEPSDFQLQKYGEVLIDLTLFSEAEAVLMRISNLKSDAFATYRLSQAKLGQGHADEALSLIDSALEALDETKQKFVGSFLAHRFKVRQTKAAPDAIDDLIKAIAASEPGKYRTYLENLRKKVS